AHGVEVPRHAREMTGARQPTARARNRAARRGVPASAPRGEDRRTDMKTMLTAAILAVALAAPALADSAKLQGSVPGGATTVTNWYKQSVYDAKNNKIGDVNDVLTSKDGKIETLIIGVGGFLGVGEKDVAVPFDAVKLVKKDDKWTLTMDTTKDALKQARGFKYDRTATTWKPE